MLILANKDAWLLDCPAHPAVHTYTTSTNGVMLLCRTLVSFVADCDRHQCESLLVADIKLIPHLARLRRLVSAATYICLPNLNFTHLSACELQARIWDRRTNRHTTATRNVDYGRCRSNGQ